MQVTHAPNDNWQDTDQADRIQPSHVVGMAHVAVETVAALAIDNGVVEVDCALANYFTLSLTDDVNAFVFANVPQACRLTIEITYGETLHFLAWPANFTWVNHQTPTLLQLSGASDVLTLMTFNGGETWRCSLSPGFYEDDTSVDPYLSNVRSLLHFEGPDGATNITDQVAGREWTATPVYNPPGGVNAISNEKKKFGATALHHEGRDVAFATDSDLIPDGSVPHTLECWVLLDSLDTTANNIYSWSHVICSQIIDASSGQQAFYIYGSPQGTDAGKIGYDSASAIGPSGSSFVIVSNAKITLGEWHHLAFDYDGQYIRLFLDGMMSAKSERAIGWIPTINPFFLNGWKISSYPDYRHGFNGYIDEFRATYGVSRYGTDVSFTPPAHAFPDPQ
jgi:hypothetical protein